MKFKYSYVLEKNRINWNGDCIILSESFYLTHEKIESKGITCHSNLCNKPENFQSLLNASLCKDGFYA